MRRAGGLLLLTLMLCGVALAEEDPFASLAWMAGRWQGEANGIAMEEYWMTPEGSVMPGVHRDLFPNGRTFFEYLRIEKREDAIVYVASPRGGPSTDFTLTQNEANRAVFENPEHDFPQSIEYVRDGDTLTATVKGLANGEIRSTSWTWRRVSGD